MIERAKVVNLRRKNNMKLGNGDKASWNKNVNGADKKVISVDACEMMTQSSSRSRGGRMDLQGGTVKPMQPANRDTYQ